MAFIKADIEIGGTDQKFNILMGRTMQKQYGQENQACIFMPLLEGTDGVEKMSKSFGNYIGIDESAEVMFQKTMTIPDSLIVKYYELVTDVHPDEINSIKERLKNGINPRDIKMELADEITALYYGKESAAAARAYFVSLYQKGQVPEDIREVKITDTELTENGTIDLVKVIVSNGMAASNSEARRLITQNALKINGEKYTSFTLAAVAGETVIQLGKAKFLKIIE